MLIPRNALPPKTENKKQPLKCILEYSLNGNIVFNAVMPVTPS